MQVDVFSFTQQGKTCQTINKRFSAPDFLNILEGVFAEGKYSFENIVEALNEAKPSATGDDLRLMVDNTRSIIRAYKKDGDYSYTRIAEGVI